jgi:uncharacterized protein YbjT (DUF2867 family)
MHTSSTLVIGANGQIGHHLLGMMALAGLPAKALIRDEAQAVALKKLGADIVISDLESPLSPKILQGCDRIVFTAGSGGHTGADKTILVDLWGACKAIDLAKELGLKHFVMVSARDAGDPEHGNPAIKPYNICKHFADEYLMKSGVPYTILRPGRLLNEQATGLITTERPQDKAEQVITRTDVAACIVETLRQSEATGQVLELYNGDQPVRGLYQPVPCRQ